MQHLKIALIAIIMSATTLFLFFIGLGVSLFALITLAIASIYVKVTSNKKTHKQHASQWYQYFTADNAKRRTSSKHKSDIIEGNYEIIDN